MLEQTITSRDGTSLSYRHWVASGAKDTVLIVHGYAEHSGRYTHVAEFLNAQGFNVYGMDLRGHGKSAGARGHVNRFSEYHEDVLTMIEHICSESSENPFLLAHSLGGLVVLSTLISSETEVPGVILSSPFMGMSMKVSPAKALMGRILSSVYPALSLPNEIPPQALSRDATVGEQYSKDPLVFKTATARWFTESMVAIEEVFKKAPQIKYPCLLLQAGDDRIADVAATRRLFAALGASDNAYIEYDGYRHEIFNEHGKEKCLDDISDWLKSRRQA